MNSGKQYCGNYPTISPTNQEISQLPTHSINFPSTSSTSSSGANEEELLHSSNDSYSKVRRQLATMTIILGNYIGLYEAYLDYKKISSM